jgi:prepilin-type N-terminal cleavage/methylation domain-containing protein
MRTRHTEKSFGAAAAGVAARSAQMSKKGFTLVELLVVIAIITILAAIVVPKIPIFIGKGNMGKAISEIENAKLATTNLLTDTGKSDFRQMFSYWDPTLQNGREAEEIYTIAMYNLLRLGRTVERDGNGNFTINGRATIPKVILDQLGTLYLDMKEDPWGQKYHFYAGPIPATQVMPFRCYRAPVIDDVNNFKPYRYDVAAKQELDKELPGNPQPDFISETAGPYGFPATRSEAIYIWSWGLDSMGSQLFEDSTEVEKLGGGDDINSWDTKSGWRRWYN